MKTLPSSKPFEKYKVYGPYIAASMGRRTVRLKLNGVAHSMSYARYLMCVALGRLLKPTETVDHIDNDKLNDSLDNLQLLSMGDNIRKSHRPRAVRHGTLACYRHCKCDLCRKVKADYMRKYKLARR